MSALQVVGGIGALGIILALFRALSKWDYRKALDDVIGDDLFIPKTWSSNLKAMSLAAHTHPGIDAAVTTAPDEFDPDAVTQWFHGLVRPVHVGHYQRDYEFEGCPAEPDYWDGIDWMYSQNSSYPCLYQNRRWRGLANRPADSQ